MPRRSQLITKQGVFMVVALIGLAYEVSSSHFGPDSITPSPFDERLFPSLPVKIARAAGCSGVVQKPLDIEINRAELTARGMSLRERLDA